MNYFRGADANWHCKLNGKVFIINGGFPSEVVFTLLLNYQLNE